MTRFASLFNRLPLAAGLALWVGCAPVVGGEVQALSLPAPVACTLPAAPAPSGAAEAAGDLFVSAAARLGGDGSRARPFRTIREGVANVRSGGAVVVGAGVYRETVVLDRSLSLLGAPGAIIKGSDVWTGWRPEGRHWVKPYDLAFSRHGECRAGSDGRCKLADGVFRDGVPLRQRTELSRVGADDFYAGDGKLYLGADPAGREIEVVVRERWVEPAAGSSPGSVTVRGFVMTHAASRAQTGAIEDRGNPNWTVAGNDLSYAHGIGVKLDGPGAVIQGNRVHRNGQLGVASSRASGLRLLGNTIACNHTEDFSTGWEAGGTKITRSRDAVMQGNVVFDNDGAGLWCDIDCDNVRFVGNKVHHNAGSGIAYEISKTCLVEGNALWENGFGFNPWVWGAGIMIQNASGCEVRNNVLAWNAGGVAVVEQERGSQYYPTNNLVRDNLVAAGPTGYALAFASDLSPHRMFVAEAGNRGEANRFWWLPVAGMPRFHWVKGIEVLEPFLATQGGLGGRQLSSEERDRALSAAGVPLRPEAR